jgi:hypothetical protein
MTYVVEFKQEMKNGKAVDMVLIAPRDDVQKTQTWHRVEDLRPLAGVDEDANSLNKQHMNAVWSVVEPAHKAWLEGVEIPETGTPLGVWPAINEQQAQIFRAAHIRTIEDVAEMTETSMGRVRLPNVRQLRDQAAKFLEGRDTAGLSQQLAEQQNLNQAMLEKMEAMQAEIAAMREDKPKRGRPKKEEAEAA